MVVEASADRWNGMEYPEHSAGWWSKGHTMAAARWVRNQTLQCLLSDRLDGRCVSAVTGHFGSRRASVNVTWLREGGRGMSAINNDLSICKYGEEY
jgi:lysophospholipid acyltransferase (LPLAT)-like uncharacterized protein